MRALIPVLLTLALSGCGSTWTARDEDGDGISLLQGDCDDSPGGGGGVGPATDETWYDGVDGNCDGLDDFDKDRDGFQSAEFGGDDCWDDPDVVPEAFEALNGFAALTASAVNPGGEDTFYDGIDANCDDASDFDADADGYDTSNADYSQRDGSIGDDCYDSFELDAYPASGEVTGAEAAPADVNPGVGDADLWYDGTDGNCDGQSDYDQDGDGYNLDAECDDTNAAIVPDPSVEEIWYNDDDENCDGNRYDKDGDGFESAEYGGTDCWDDPDVTPTGFTPINGFGQPSADEVFPAATYDRPYDGVDGDCGGDSDFDADDDGVATLDWPDESGVYGDDCDDTDGDIYPAASDAWYDGIDSDCGGDSDYDADGDGFDSSDDLSAGTDCDDSRSLVNPDATELCATSYDDDCDGALDLEDAIGCLTWFRDGDGDGYGTVNSECWCEEQTATGYDSTRDDDCSDGNAAVNPGATEICDASDTDEDCDGSADNNDATAATAGKTRFYHDDDDDGFGDEDHPGGVYCDNPGSSSQAWVTDNTDCDDAADDDYPGAAETVANGDDEDCDSVDSCYTDNDGDNFGTTVVVDGSTLSCVTGTGAAVSTDCDDTSALDYPSATETVANGDDEDCDSFDSCYTDADGDNFGTTVIIDGSSLDCAAGSGAAVSTDCDDASALDFPGASETVANGDDEDCDSFDSCYTDADGDNFGTTVVITGSSLSCAIGTGAPVSTDCDDSDATTNPGALDPTDGTLVDNDCDGYVDDDGIVAGSVVVNEYFVSGSVEYEWFELYNNSGFALDLDGWTLTLCSDSANADGAAYVCDGGTNAGESLVVIGLSGELAANDYLVVCNDDASFESPADCDIVNAYLPASDGLHADQGSVAIEMGAVFVDDINWWTDSGDSWPTSGVYSTQFAVELLDGDSASTNDDWSSNGSSANQWCLSDETGNGTAIDWAAGEAYFGTPGLENHACP